MKKIEIINCDPYALDSSAWIMDSKQFPKVFLLDVFFFLIERSSVYTQEKLRAYKSLEAYSMLLSGWVSNVKFLKLNDHYLIFGKVSNVSSV